MDFINWDLVRIIFSPIDLILPRECHLILLHLIQLWLRCYLRNIYTHWPHLPSAGCPTPRASTFKSLALPPFSWSPTLPRRIMGIIPVWRPTDWEARMPAFSFIVSMRQPKYYCTATSSSTSVYMHKMADSCSLGNALLQIWITLPVLLFFTQKLQILSACITPNSQCSSFIQIIVNFNIDLNEY